MLALIQSRSYAEFDMFLRLISSGGLIAAVGYVVSLERRLSRIEGKLTLCRYPCDNKGEE